MVMNICSFAERMDIQALKMARKEYDEIRIAHFDGNLQTRMDSSRFFRIKRKSVLAAATGVGSKRALYFIEIY